MVRAARHIKGKRTLSGIDLRLRVRKRLVNTRVIIGSVPALFGRMLSIVGFAVDLLTCMTRCRLTILFLAILSRLLLQRIGRVMLLGVISECFRFGLTRFKKFPGGLIFEQKRGLVEHLFECDRDRARYLIVI